MRMTRVVAVVAVSWRVDRSSGWARRLLLGLVTLALVALGVLLDRTGPQAAAVAVGEWICAPAGTPEREVIRAATDERSGVGWAGADTGGATRLTDGRIVWTYGDTFVGAVGPDGTRDPSTVMVSNTLAVQQGTCVRFLVRPTATGWADWFHPDADPTSAWWPTGVIEHRGRVYVGYGAWGQAAPGAIVGPYLGSMIAEYDPATFRLLAVHPTPFSGWRQWGTGFADAGDAWLYVYGVDHDYMLKRWLVARWDGADRWEFPTHDGSWTTDQARLAPLLGGEQQDHFPQPFPWLGGIGLITTDGQFEGLDVVSWWAPHPSGPYQPLGVIASIPDDTEVPAPYRYLGAAVPDTDGRLLVAWNINTFRTDWLPKSGRARLIDYLTAGMPPVGSRVAPPAPGLVPPDVPGQVPESAGAFTALTPTRVLDTRDGTGGVHLGKVAAGTSVTLPVAGRAGVPNDAVAVALNLTATEPEGPGYLTLWPTGRPRPLASNLNVERGDVRADLVVVPVGASGAVDVYSMTTAHVVVDVAGYWTAIGGATTAGRFVAVTPARIVDTREGLGAASGPAAPGTTLRVTVAGRGGLPVSGVGGVALSVTTTGVVRDGWLVVFPCGVARPLASSLNAPAGGTRANLALVPLGQGGCVDIYTHAGGHVIVDIMGGFTDSTAPEATAGLLVTLPYAVRFLDTREGLGGFARMGPRTPRSLQVGGTGWVPSSATAVVATVTMVGAAGPSYCTVWPDGEQWPVASNTNTERAGQIAPVAVTTRLGDGRLNLLTYTAGQLVLDVAGWFTS